MWTFLWPSPTRGHASFPIWLVYEISFVLWLLVSMGRKNFGWKVKFKNSMRSHFRPIKHSTRTIAKAARREHSSDAAPFCYRKALHVPRGRRREHDELISINRRRKAWTVQTQARICIIENKGKKKSFAQSRAPRLMRMLDEMKKSMKAVRGNKKFFLCCLRRREKKNCCT